MAEYIGCRKCDSPDCKGCNIYTLAKMLDAGKFDFLMNGNRSINPFADVVEVVRGEWVHNDRKEVRCSRCNALFGVGRNLSEIVEDVNFCFNCGADMRGESNG